VNTAAAGVERSETREPSQPRARDFARLKARLVRNGLRGYTWRVVAYVIGTTMGVWLGALGMIALSASATASVEVGYVVAALSGTAVVVGWTVVPLLFFGVDETLDPARFALLPLRRGTVVRGMLAAAMVSVPVGVTLLATSGLVVAAAVRFGWVAAGFAAVGVVIGLLTGLVASRAVTSAFAGLLRSRRVRDLAAVLIALLASSIGPLQLVVLAVIRSGELDGVVRVARVLGWTPLAAAYLLPYDVAAGDYWAVAGRAGVAVAALVGLVWWWSRTLESAMLGGESVTFPSRRRGPVAAVAALIPWPIRASVGKGTFAAILAREWRFWWRDARRRAAIVSVLVASAVLPVVIELADTIDPAQRRSAFGTATFGFGVAMSGTMGGMLLGNQFAFDGSAYAAHLLGQIRGRMELLARMAAIGVIALPLQTGVVGAAVLAAGSLGQLPLGLGLLVASFGAACAIASLLSVLAPYPLPNNANPFALNSGAGSAKGMLALVAMFATMLVCLPMVSAAMYLSATTVGPWLILVAGIGYGATAIWLATRLGGALLDRRGPEVLASVTSRQ
jgi:ABC-2 type transport system permease protein